MSGTDRTAGQQPAPDVRGSGASRADSQYRQLFDEVLRQTVSLTEDESVSSEAEMKKLFPVAVKYRKAALDAVPILTELVEAMLRTSLGGGTVEQLRPMSQQVAETIFEDPAGRKRVERLWQQLQQSIEP